MLVKITSNVPYLKGIDGEHKVDGNLTVEELLISLGVTWDEDALVLINGKFSHGDEKLEDQDHIQLLVPIAGG